MSCTDNLFQLVTRGYAKVTSKRPYYARREFIAVEHEAFQLIREGHSIASAYDSLVSEDKITMGYRTFARYIKGDTKKKKLLPPVVVGEATEKRKVNEYAKKQLGVDPQDIKNQLGKSK